MDGSPWAPYDRADHLEDGMHAYELDWLRKAREDVRPRHGAGLHREATGPVGRLAEVQRLAGNRAAAELVARGQGATVQREGEGRGAITLPPVEMTSAGPSIPVKPTGDGGDAGAVPSGPPGPLADDEEAEYKAWGEEKLAQLGGGAAATGYGATGHTPVGPITGFPDWFSSLQNALISSTEWRADPEEKAQNLLAQYAIKRFATSYGGDETRIPPTVRAYCQYIGRSTSNQKAAAKAGLPSSANMGGAEGAKMWCAAAGSSSIRMALESVGLTFATSWVTWLNKPPVPSIGVPKAAVDGPIEPGDQVSYVGGGAPAIGGHTTTAISSSLGEGTEFLHVSGNAGGGTSGSIRFGSSKPRGKPPGSLGFGDFATKSPASIGAPSDKVWVYAIVQYSRLWEDLGKIDATAPGVWQSAAGIEFCKKYQLKPMPVST